MKALDEFYKRSNRPSGYQGRCKKCSNSRRWEGGRFRDEEHKQQVLASNRQSYQKHRSKYIIQTGQRNAARKMKALEAKGQISCSRCGFDNPAALEFHHRDPSLKSFNITFAIARPKTYPWELVEQELGKCDVLCANCHKIEHCNRMYEVRKSVERNEDWLGQKEAPNKRKAK